MFLRTNEHGRIIRSMTILAAEVGMSDSIHLWEYMKTLCVMLPDLELHSLNIAYGDLTQDFNKLNLAYKSLEDRSHYWVIRLPESKMKQAIYGTTNNLAAQ